MPTPPRPSDPAAILREKAGLIVWILVLLAVLLVPLLILAKGYLPQDDCLRHAAKAVDGRPWAEILVLRPGLMADPNAAWHALLRAFHLATGAGTDALVVATVVLLFWLVLLAPLPWLRAPEAWLAAWTLMFVSGASVYRLIIGRPLLVNMAALVMIMAMWNQDDPGRRRPPWQLALTTLLMAAAALLHGSWYLLGLIPAAFLLAGHVRNGLQLAGCWLAGSVLAGLGTGHPVEFLFGQLLHLRHVLDNAGDPAALVLELRPSGGGGLVALVCLGAAVVMLLRGRRPAWLLADPLFMLALGCWVLGLRIQRFWMDWGLPCAALWLAFQAETLLVDFGRRRPWRRLQVAAGIALSFLLITTADVNGRWSVPIRRTFLSQDRPELKGWLPAPGGILYAEGMEIFFETFFRNPGAPWRYMIGYEATQMPPEDQKVFLDLARGEDLAQTLAPWIARMRPEDRLALRGTWKRDPGIPGLEWFHAGGDLWVGRTRR